MLSKACIAGPVSSGPHRLACIVWPASSGLYRLARIAWLVQLTAACPALSDPVLILTISGFCNMSWKGRIIGALIGLLFGGIGALIGFLIGYYFYDKPRNQLIAQSAEARNAFAGRGPRSAMHKTLIQSTFRLMGFVSRGAGRINESHIRQAEYFMDVMNLDAEMRALAIEGFNQGKSDDFDLHAEAMSLRSAIGSNIAMLSFLLEIQVGIALADQVLSEGEHERLLQIAIAMDVPVDKMERLIRIRFAEVQFAQFARKYAQQQQQQQQQNSQRHRSSRRSGTQGSSGQYQGGGYQHDQGSSSSGGSFVPKSELANAYEILGVDENTSWEDIRRAHKKLMLKYHPDRLASQGLPPEMIKLYTQKATDIQTAFNIIKEARGE